MQKTFVLTLNLFELYIYFNLYIDVPRIPFIIEFNLLSNANSRRKLRVVSLNCILNRHDQKLKIII